MERITDPVFRNEYGECEKERLEKRMERTKAIEERLLAYRTDHNNTGKNMDAEHEFNSNAIDDIEYLLAENKRLTSVLEKIGFTSTDVDALKAYHSEYEQWKATQDKEVFYVDWFHYLARTALKQK